MLGETTFNGLDNLTFKRLRRRFKRPSVLFKMLSSIGVCLLLFTILQLVTLPRNFLVTTEATDSGVSYYVTILSLNSALFLVIALVVRHMYVRHIQDPLQQLSRVLQQPTLLSESTITDLSKTASCREIRDFSKTALRLLKSLYKLLEQFTQTTEPLLEASQMLVSSSQAQSSRITFQYPSHQKIRSSIQELMITAKQVNADIHAVADISTTTLQVAERGQQSIMSAKANMEEIYRSSRMSSEKIVALEKHTEHIHEVVATIDRIIEDTKLIAFNATIEAARAKENGKGFGVVALEIKRLAEEVFESTEDIKEFIQEIRHASHALVVSTESELKSVQHGGALTEEAGISLQHICDTVERTVESAQKIATTTERQQGTSEHVLHLVETTNRAIEQFGRDMQDFTATAERLHQQAESLILILGRPFPGLNRQHRVSEADA